MQVLFFTFLRQLKFVWRRLRLFLDETVQQHDFLIHHREQCPRNAVDNLGDGIWEVRSRLSNRIARTLFAVVDEEIVLLHGFIKKQQRTPQDELDLAKKRKKQYLL